MHAICVYELLAYAYMQTLHYFVVSNKQGTNRRSHGNSLAQKAEIEAKWKPY